MRGIGWLTVLVLGMFWSQPVAQAERLAPKVAVKHKGCLIFITAHLYDLSTEGGRDKAAQDVLLVKAKLEDALKGSADMRKKVEEACEKNGLKDEIVKPRLNIFVGRDVPGVDLGVANLSQGRSPGNFVLDLEDMDRMDKHFKSGSDPGLVAKIVRNYLVRTLAHEMDHLRDDPNVGFGGRVHVDPGGRQAEFRTGPAVDDANQVMAELGECDRRSHYGGNEIGFTGGGKAAVLDLLSLVNAGRRVKGASGEKARGQKAARLSGDVDGALAAVPDRPCESQDDAACYRLPVLDDSDLDTVPDDVDNCPLVSNPQQDSLDCEPSETPPEDDPLPNEDEDEEPNDGLL